MERISICSECLRRYFKIYSCRGGCCDNSYWGIDLAVFLSGWYGDWRKKRFQEAVEAAIQEARDEGYEEGYAAGQQDKDSEDDETD